MKYVTICTCPVCGTVIDEVRHPEEKPHAQSIAMCAGDGRREHRRNSPSCADDPRWVRGWDQETKPIAELN